MNSKNQDFTEFEELIVELGKPEIRPYAPELPAEIKQQMRRNLFAPEEEVNELSPLAIKNLWKFAGGAAVVVALLFAVASLIAVLSNPSTQVGPNATTEADAPTADLSELVAELALSTNVETATIPPTHYLNANIGDILNLTGYDIRSLSNATSGDDLELTAQWQVIDPAKAGDTEILFQVRNESGRTVAQTAVSFADSDLENLDEQQVTYSIALPADLSLGYYDLVLQAKEHQSESLHKIFLNVGGDFPNGLPNDDFTNLWLETFLYTPATQLVELDHTQTANDENSIQITHAEQRERLFAEEELHYFVAVEYDLQSRPAAAYNVLFTDDFEKWQGANDPGTAKVFQPDFEKGIIQANHFASAFGFPVEPNELREALGTENPIMVIQLGYLESDLDGATTFVPESIASMSEANFDLQAVAHLVFGEGSVEDPRTGATNPNVVTKSAKPVGLMDRIIVFDDRVQLAGYQFESTPEGTLLRLHWWPLAILDDRFHVFVQFIDETGNLVLQTDGPPSLDMPLMGREVIEIEEGELLLPTNNLPNGRYDIYIGLYNTETDVKLPISAMDGKVLEDEVNTLFLTCWAPNCEQAEDSNNKNVQFGESIELLAYQTLFNGKNYNFHLQWQALADALPDYSLSLQAVNDAGEVVAQVDNPILGNGRSSSEWTTNRLVNGSESISIGDLPEGNYNIQLILYNPETGARLPVSTSNPGRVTDNNSAVILANWDKGASEDTLFLISATQQERPSTASPITIDVTIGYHLDSEPAAELDLWFVSAEPNASNSEPPLGITEKRSVVKGSYGSGVEAFSFTGSPEDIMTLINSEQLFLQANLSHMVETNNGPQQQSLVRKTFPHYLVDLSRTDEISYFFNDEVTTSVNSNQESGEVWLIAASQKERAGVDSWVEIEYTLGYEFVSDENVFIKMSYGDPKWDEQDDIGRLPVDGLDNPIFLENKQGEFTITTAINPREAKQITRTDNPVLIAEMGYILPGNSEVDNQFVYLANETFITFPLDLSRTDEISASILDSLNKDNAGTQINNFELGGPNRKL